MADEKIIARGFGFKVYYRYSEQRYYIDTYKPIIPSYSTIEAVAEALYYGGYIPAKDIGCLNAYSI